MEQKVCFDLLDLSPQTFETMMTVRMGTHLVEKGLLCLGQQNLRHPTHAALFSCSLGEMIDDDDMLNSSLAIQTYYSVICE